MDLKPRVTVCIATYNQERYIEDTIMSALNQNVDFDYEILVGDDCSSDNTSEILKLLQKKHPDKIKLCLRNENIGVVKNIIDIYKKAKGEYIVHLDGDDLMDPTKLAVQVEILDNYPNVFFCTHDVSLIDLHGIQIKNSFRRWPEGEQNLNNLLSQLPFFAHSSKMFRNNISISCWDDLSRDNLIDIELHVEHAKLGNIYHIDSVLGRYRVFSGISTQKRQVNPLLPKATDRIFNKIFKENPSSLIKKYYAKAILAYSYQSGLLSDKKMAAYYAKKSFGIAYYSPIQFIFYLISFVPCLLVYFTILISRLKDLKVALFK